MDDDTLEILVRLRNGRVTARELDLIRREVDRLTVSTQRQGVASKVTGAAAHGLNKAWRGLIWPAMKVAGGLGLMTTAAIGWQGLNFNSTMEQNTVSFTHFLGSTRAAHKYLDQLYNLAATTPFEFKDVTTATKQMLAFGFGSQEAIRNLRTIGDAASGLGTGTEGINRMVLALGQMKVAGVVQGDELRQFQEAGINVYKYMIKAGLITKDDIGQIGMMHIDSTKAIAAIMAGMQKDFGGLSKNQAKTWQGQLSTMKDYAAQAAGALTKPIFDLGRSRVLPRINDTLQKVAGWARGGGVNKAGSALKAGFEARSMAAVQGFTGTQGIAARAGVRLGQAWEIVGKVFDEVKPVVLDLWKILRKLWAQVLRPLVPIVAVGLYVAFKLLAAVIHFVADNFETLRLVLTPLVAGFVAYKTVTGAITLATKGWATAQLLLNGLLAANPIGLVVAGVAALVIGFIVLYQKVGWFRRGVQAVWGWLKANWPTLVAILAGPIGIAVLLIVKHWDKLKGAATAVKDWVKAAFNDVVDFFRKLPGRIADAARGAFEGLKSAFRAAYNFIASNWNKIQLTFELPGVLKKLPGPDRVTIGVPDMPLLADGGDVVRRGAAIVGEKGPEILDLPEGARVTPLGRGGKVREVVRLVTVEGKVLAEAVFDAAETAAARA